MVTIEILLKFDRQGYRHSVGVDIAPGMAAASPYATRGDYEMEPIESSPTYTVTFAQVLLEYQHQAETKTEINASRGILTLPLPLLGFHSCISATKGVKSPAEDASDDDTPSVSFDHRPLD